jgi:hypothetical protein
MFQAPRLLAICCLVGAVLAPCGGQQVQAGAGVVPPGQSSLASISPLGGSGSGIPACGGTPGGATASPCPLYLTGSSGATVTVSGPGVVATYAAAGCLYTAWCQFQQDTQTLYTFYPNGKCGKSYVIFEAFNASGASLGVTWITILRSKTYCK